MSDFDIVLVREEDTAPTTVSDGFRKRLADRYAGKDLLAFDSELIEIREEDTKPSTVSESFRKRLREKYGSDDSSSNGPGRGPFAS